MCELSMPVRTILKIADRAYPDAGASPLHPHGDTLALFVRNELIDAARDSDLPRALAEAERAMTVAIEDLVRVRDALAQAAGTAPAAGEVLP